VLRTSRDDLELSEVTITVRNPDWEESATLKNVSLTKLPELDGILVIAAKSFANTEIARTLKEKGAQGPVVLLQNGLGVEKPFLEAGFPDVYRCVLYLTSQTYPNNLFTFEHVKPSPIGTLEGSGQELQDIVDALSTARFPFRPLDRIQQEVWRKVVANAVFNSVCPLLDVDNGIFARDSETAALALELVRECVQLTDRLGLGLGEEELFELVMAISGCSDQYISTLQDIKAGRPTEIDSMNLEIARIGSALDPPVLLPRIELLGKMIQAKSRVGNAG